MYNQTMQMIKKYWQQFKTQPDLWFFYGFLITFTLSIRKVLFFYPIEGQFSEYTGIYLYLSDIFLMLTILAWGYSILYNNKFVLSNIVSRAHNQLTNVPRGTLVVVPLIFVIWSFISLVWADNKILALFRSIKFTEFYLLYLYIIHIVPRGTILRRSLQIIITTGVIQAIIGIIQVILQHSLGFSWLRESLLSPSIPGVAKLIFANQGYIRAYGLFPHPDVLGGLLLVSIILSWQYIKLFHACPVGCSTWNIPTGVEQLWIKRAMPILIVIQSTALLLAFCKSAIIGIILAAMFIIWKNVPRGTFSLRRILEMFHVEHLSRKLILSLGIILFLGFIIRPDINSLFFKSLDERVLYQNVSRGTIATHPIIGIGNGQFVDEMQKYTNQHLENWQYQPVHNVFLLIWSELGIIGLLIFIWWLWKLFHVEQKITKTSSKCSTWNKITCETYKPNHTHIVPRGTILEKQKVLAIFQGALLGFIFIMLFDHYLWDIQQGQILLWLVAGLIAVFSRDD